MSSMKCINKAVKVDVKQCKVVDLSMKLQIKLKTNIHLPFQLEGG